MENLASGASSENNRTIEKFLLLRVLVTTLVVGAGIMIAQLANEGFPIRPVCILLLVSFTLGGVHYLSFRRGFDKRKLLWSIMVADILLGTAIVHWSGGVTSPFTLIYCFPIVAAAFLLEVHGGLGIALLASCAYVAVGVMHSRGLLENPLGSPASDSWIVKLYLDVSIFFLVGSVSGYLAERMKSRSSQLATAESELKQLKVDTDKILENMSSGVLVVDSKGKILTLNPAAGEILGFEREELLFKRLKETIAAVMPQLSTELEYALTSEESKQRHEIVIENNRGEQIPLGISISLLRDGGRKRGVIAVFQNLTEVREMQERIRKADRLAAIGELSAGIAHEIRNPLASISGSIEMLQNELELDQEQDRLMKLILRESDRLNHIITDFLEFARMRPPAKRVAYIDKCLGDVLVLMGNNANFGCGIDVELDQQAVGGRVKIDEEQVRQVFLNLCINACESMEGHGKLRIETRLTDDNQLSIVFQDEGSGIDTDDLDHLFEPFFTTKDGGTGLGLAIANKIIEAHGGRIIYQNREHSGAEFRVMLPAMETTESTCACSSQVAAKCTS